VRWLLSQQVGLPHVDPVMPMADVYRWTPMVEALAAQRPAWEPGTAHGYHAMTYGWLVGEVLARVTGLTPGEILAKEIAAPLGIEFHVGLPESQMDRVAPLVLAPPPAPGTPLDALTALMLDPAQLAHRAFFIPNGLFTAMNDRAAWAAQLPAANGMATARALSTMYAACLGEVAGVRLLSPETLAAATTPQAEGTTGCWASRAGSVSASSCPTRCARWPARARSGTTASAARSASRTPSTGSRSATWSTRCCRAASSTRARRP
jgi:CubicO group peptidase (beta-lactamase class C family)